MTRQGDEAATPPPRELLSGTVERVTFRSEETGFTVLRVKVRGRRELVTVVGAAGAVSAGESVQASGAFVNDPRHGLQFKAAHLTSEAPATAEGIERYLSSGLVRGIGPSLARRLVERFGAALFETIEERPDELRSVAGIGPVRAGRIRDGWAEQKAVREIMLFLHSNGVSTARAVRIHRTYGADAIALVRENPYRLARDIRGIGFRTADVIAGKLGIEKTAMIRARAGLSYALLEATDDGHCGLSRGDLLELAGKLLEVPAPILEEALELELAGSDLVADEVSGRPCVFLASLHTAERVVASRLLGLASGPPPWPAVDLERAVPWVEERLGLTLAPAQRQALLSAVSSKLLVITGGPGVGKTTLVNAILKVLLVKGVKIVLCAPTGRAAKRLSESTGLLATTVHRLLEVDPKTGGFRRGPLSPLEADLVVVDETSMLDVPLARSLLSAVPDRAGLLLVGDVDQLPSVGPGQVLRDVIEAHAVPVVRLEEVFRQAAESRIVVNAHRINRGEMPELRSPAGSDFYVASAEDPETAPGKLLHIVTQRIPKAFGLDPVRDVQVLCPMNRGGLGARSLNAALQQALNPPRPGEEALRVERFGQVFAAGDKVMQLANDYTREVYNGDLGVVSRVDPEERQLFVDFEGREVAYDTADLDDLTLAYAVTIHKSQGSEYPAVVVPVSTQHYPMLQRNLLYTAVTRGRRLVVLVAQRKALAIAVRNASAGRRVTRLAEWLRAPRS